jgi:Tfp pilus assembly protein PilN
MIKVNLVPVEILAKARQRQQMLQAAAVGVALLVLIAGMSFVHFFTLKRLESKLAYDEGELKKLEVIVKKVEELEKTAAAVRARLNVITDLLKGRPLYPYFMADFVRSVPPGVRVKTVTTTGGGSSATPLKLVIAAEARTDDDIAGWTRRLEDSGKFTLIELGTVTTIEADPKVYNFTLTTVYTPTL